MDKNTTDIQKINLFSKNIKRKILDMAFIAGSSSSHFGGALSIVEIISTLFSHQLKIKRDDPEWIDRDRFILSKGHACLAYYAALSEIGYLKEEGNDFKIDTKKLDSEISSIAGPQLVVPIMNSRYTLNAANARWVSLYDSLYGTDLIESEETGSQKYDPLRGQEVIRYAVSYTHLTLPTIVEV